MLLRLWWIFIGLGFLVIAVVIYVAFTLKVDVRRLLIQMALFRSKKRTLTRDTVVIVIIWLFLIVAGIVLVWLAVSEAGHSQHIAFQLLFGVAPFAAPTLPPSGIYTALLWALGCLVVGSFLGFIFGVPHVVQSAGSQAAAGDLRRASIAYRANTALEQVTDWLTKIVVGVGLVELQKIPHYLKVASEQMSAGYGNQPASVAFGVALIIYFSFVGFLGSYLMTRLYLQDALLRSDNRTLGSASEKANLTSEETIALREGVIGFSERERSLTGAAAAAAAKMIRELGMADLESARDFALWGKAQLDAKQPDLAVAAYQKARSLAPADISIALEYATALYLRERSRRKGLSDTGSLPDNNIPQDEIDKREAAAKDVRSALRDAYDGLYPGVSSDLRRNIFKNLTYVYLFPDCRKEDFEEAIRYGEEYVLNPRHIPSGGIAFNLACAYGQKYTWLDEQPKGTEEEERRRTFDKRAARDKALTYLKQALALDPTWAVRFKKLIIRDFPGKEQSDDDDLVAFENDPEFRFALGLPGRAPLNAPSNPKLEIEGPVLRAHWGGVEGATKYRFYIKIGDTPFRLWGETQELGTDIENPLVPGIVKFYVLGVNDFGPGPRSAEVTLNLTT